jgi:enamine deaminase RidA (YjgF/YER057c/UK114 family)
MPSRNVNPPELGPPTGFSHVTISGNTVWLGGQIGCDSSGRVLAPGDMVAQYTRAIGNVAIALRAAGCAPADTVKLTYLVTDAAAYRANLKAIGAAYRDVFGRHFPATTLLEVKGLFDPQAMVEIEAVAVIP